MRSTGSTGSLSVEEMLRDVCVVAARAVGIDGVGAVLNRDDGVCLLHPDPGRIVLIDPIPAAPAVHPQPDVAFEPIMIEDIAISRRRPDSVGLSGQGIRSSVLATPMLTGSHCWGALNLYFPVTRPWTERDLAVIRVLADVAASRMSRMADSGGEPASLDRQAAREHARDRHADGPAAHRAQNQVPVGPDSEPGGQVPGGGIPQRAPVVVLVMDIDGFGDVMDALGHDAGALLLTELARRAGDCLAGGATLGRWTPDGFVVICRDITASPAGIDHQLRAIGQRAQLRLRRPSVVGQPEVVISVSTGVAMATHRRSTEALLIDAARVVGRSGQLGGVGGQRAVAQLPAGRSAARSACASTASGLRRPVWASGDGA